MLACRLGMAAFGHNLVDDIRRDLLTNTGAQGGRFKCADNAMVLVRLVEGILPPASLLQ